MLNHYKLLKKIINLLITNVVVYDMFIYVCHIHTYSFKLIYKYLHYMYIIKLENIILTISMNYEFMNSKDRILSATLIFKKKCF